MKSLAHDLLNDVPRGKTACKLTCMRRDATAGVRSKSFCFLIFGAILFCKVASRRSLDLYALQGRTSPSQGEISSMILRSCTYASSPRRKRNEGTAGTGSARCTAALDWNRRDGQCMVWESHLPGEVCCVTHKIIYMK